MEKVEEFINVITRFFQSLGKLAEAVGGLPDAWWTDAIVAIIIGTATLVVILVLLILIRFFSAVYGFTTSFHRFDPTDDIEFPHIKRGSVFARAFLALSGTNYEAFVSCASFKDRAFKLLTSTAILVCFVYMIFSYWVFLNISVFGDLGVASGWQNASIVSISVFFAFVMILVDISILVSRVDKNTPLMSFDYSRVMATIMFRVTIALMVGGFSSSVAVVYLFKPAAELAAKAEDNAGSQLQQSRNDLQTRYDKNLATVSDLTAKINESIKELDCLSLVKSVESGSRGGYKKAQPICGTYTFSGAPGTQQKRKNGTDSNYYSASKRETEVRSAIAELREQQKNLSESLKGPASTLSKMNDDIARHNQMAERNFVDLYRVFMKKTWENGFFQGINVYAVILFFLSIELLPIICKISMVPKKYYEKLDHIEASEEVFFAANAAAFSPRMRDTEKGMLSDILNKLNDILDLITGVLGDIGSYVRKVGSAFRR